MMRVPAVLLTMLLIVPCAAGAAPPAGGARAANVPTNDRAAALRALYALEDRAEAVAAGEKTGAAATSASSELVAHWPDVRRRLARNGGSAAHLLKAGAAVAALEASLTQPFQLKRAANDVTGAFAPLFATAGERKPAALHRIDYLGRAIALSANERQWNIARLHAGELKRLWLGLRRAAVRKMNARNAVTALDAAVPAALHGIGRRNVSETLRATNSVGNAIDLVEQLYR